MSIITVAQARANNYSKCFISPLGLGDNLCMAYAARLFYESTGHKVLLGTNFADLFTHDDSFFDIVESLSLETLGTKFAELSEAGITIYLLLYTQQHRNIFSKATLSFIRQPIIASFLQQFGFSGEVILSPKFNLTPQEKLFGRFFEANQIAIISDGVFPRKSWGAKKTQDVVNALYDKFNFIQIGTKNDTKLDYVLDKRGTLSLRQVAAVLANSDLFVGNIGGLMHLARGVNCRSIITYTCAEPLELSYPCNVNIIAQNSCEKCKDHFTNDFDLLTTCEHNFNCIQNIKPNVVITEIIDCMKKLYSSHDLGCQKIFLAPSISFPIPKILANTFERNLTSHMKARMKFMSNNISNYKASAQ